METEGYLAFAIALAGLIGTWAVMKYKSDSMSRQLDKLWDWKDAHEKDAGLERLRIHGEISTLKGAWEATSSSIGHFGGQLTAISASIKSMQEDLADLKAEKRARERE